MADEDRDVKITISAKNLTEAEFGKVKKGLVGIGSQSKKTNQKTSALSRGFSSFGKAAPGALRLVTTAAALTAGAIIGVTAAVIKLGERGAAVADVKQAFDSLSLAAGETGAVMIGELRAGVKGTISDFDLMKVANKALGAGLLDSSKDARTMSEGARLLAKRTGTDTVTAFNTLTTAMASGRTAQLKQLGLFVDNKQAIEDYADATGKTVSEINDADRAAALQVATMAALRTEIAGFPPPLADFGELLERGRVFLKNLTDQLSVAISASPVFLTAMRSAGEAISNAFGGGTEGLILAIVRGLEKAAFFAIGFAQSGIQAAQTITQGFAGIKVLVFGVALAFTELTAKVTGTVAGVLEAASSIPVLGAAYGLAAEQARAVATATGDMSAKLEEQVENSMRAATGNDALGLALSGASTALQTISTDMADAGLSTSTATAVVAEHTATVTTADVATVAWAEKIKTLSPFLQEFMGRLDETKETVMLFGEATTFQMDNVNQSVGSFVPVVQGVGDVTYAQTQRMGAAFATFGLKTRDELQKTADEAVAAFEEIKAAGETSAEELAEIWEEVEKRKQAAQGGTEEFTLTSNEAIFQGSSAILNELGSKNKAAAIAQAIIQTGLAVAKSLGSAPWPANLVLAAGAFAAGMANVNKIRSAEAFREGTPRLDFSDFGRETTAALHGREAVVPRGGGHQLGREVASELARMRPGGDGGMSDELRGVVGELRDLPRAIQRAVRDGMLLGAA